ncbi:MAG TPA: hypothetical protein VN950_19050 [Terriglobales bacterium]|nr:hypothetical protein [Terriglobales bacterium]
MMNNTWRERELELRRVKGWTDSWTKTGLTEEEARDIRNGARMGGECLCGMEPTGFPLPEDPVGSFDEE